MAVRTSSSEGSSPAAHPVGGGGGWGGAVAEGGGGGALATREAMALADMACPLVLQHGPPLCAGWGWGGGSRGGEGVRSSVVEVQYY